MLSFSNTSKVSFKKDSTGSLNKDQRIMADKTNTKSFLTSGNRIVKSWISWRIAFSVFLTIMTVQAIILNFTIKDVEATKLSEIKNISKAAISAILDPEVKDALASPLSQESADLLIEKTIINGISIYSNQIDPSDSSNKSLIPISNFGQPLNLSGISSNNLNLTYRSLDNNSYEFILSTSDIGRNYTIAIRADSSKVQETVLNYVMQTIVIILLISALVTTVLMIAIGYWLLEPILFMRDNLIEASKNPENPNIPVSPFNKQDEIGSAIEIAQNLIHQNAHNINQIKNIAENKIHKLAYYDTLTSLPNRAFFVQTMADAMQSRNPEQMGRYAIIAMDIDHFKDINDSMGHNVGDAILRSVGKRLRASMPEMATVSRSGEDEFAIMMPLQSDAQNARDIAERVLNIIRAEPFKVFNEEFQIRASVGISVFPRDGIDPDQVLKNADIALNRAKEDGRDSFKEYSEDFDRVVQARFQILRDLRDAMEKDQLKFFYQPQLDLKSGRIIGAEALIRWWKPNNSKEGGVFVSPGEFIPVAEQSGLIVPIGEWILKTACKNAYEWNNKHGLDIRIAVNVSGAQFSQGTLSNLVTKVLKETKMPAQKLEIEVTESIFMDDINHTIQTLKELNALGVEIAIDDFGTGYSSLSYLRQFPIDRLKIDQSFIRNTLNNADDASITKTIIALGHALNLIIIAEGVETAEHEQFLLKEGCDEVQGFRYSKPVPHEDFIAFCKQYDGKLSSFNKS
jgi:diguanylate cyclase (GGDEF)-like protein